MLEREQFHLDTSLFDKPISFGEFDLIQLGRKFCNSGSVIEKHIHYNWYEITVVTGGEGTIFSNNTPVNVKRGDAFLSFPCDTHEIISSVNNPLKYDYLSFWHHNNDIISDFEKISYEYFEAEKRLFNDGNISSLIANAIVEINSINEKYSNDILNSIFNQIIIYTVRNFQKATDFKKNYNPNNVQSFCYQLMNYIDTHIYSIKNLNELSSVTGYNYSYLSALFKKTTSNTLSKYYSDKRLELSKFMLLEENKTITEIAELLNYSSRFTFSKAFTNKYGISPANYRAKN